MSNILKCCLGNGLHSSNKDRLNVLMWKQRGRQLPGIEPRTPIKLVQLMLSCKNWTTTSPHNPLDASVSHPATTQYASSEHLHKSVVLGSIPSDWQPFYFLYFHLITIFVPMWGKSSNLNNLQFLRWTTTWWSHCCLKTYVTLGTIWK